MPPGRQKALIIPICYTCYWFQNSLQTPLNPYLRYSSDLTDPKCHKSNWHPALIGCLAKSGQDQHELAKPYFIFKSLFLTRNIVSTRGKYPWQEHFKSPQTHPPLFKIWEWKLSPPAESGRLILWIVCYFLSYYGWSVN